MPVKYEKLDKEVKNKFKIGWTEVFSKIYFTIKKRKREREFNAYDNIVKINK